MSNGWGIGKDVLAARSLLQNWDGGSHAWLARLTDPLPAALTGNTAALAQALERLYHFDPTQALERLITEPEQPPPREPGGIGERPRTSLPKQAGKGRTAQVVAAVPAAAATASATTAGVIQEAAASAIRGMTASGIAAGQPDGQVETKATAGTRGNRQPPLPVSALRALEKAASAATAHGEQTMEAEVPALSPTARRRKAAAGTAGKSQPLAERRRALTRSMQRDQSGNRQPPASSQRPAAALRSYQVPTSSTQAATSQRPAPPLAAAGRMSAGIPPTAQAQAPDAAVPTMTQGPEASRDQAQAEAARPSDRPAADLPRSTPARSEAAAAITTEQEQRAPRRPVPMTEPRRPARRTDDLAQQLTDAALLHGVDLI